MTAKTIKRLIPIHGALIETTDRLSIRGVHMPHISLFDRVECSFIGIDLSILLGKTNSLRIKALLEKPPLLHFINVSVPGSRQKNDLRAAVERRGGGSDKDPGISRRRNAGSSGPL